MKVNFIPKCFRGVLWAAIATCAVLSCAFVLMHLRNQEMQSTHFHAGDGNGTTGRLAVIRGKMEAAELRLKRTQSLLDTARGAGERVGLPNQVLAPVLAPIQRWRDEALLRSLQEQVDYRLAAFDASDTEVLTNFGSLAEATKVMTQLFAEGVETQLRRDGLDQSSKSQTFDLSVRRSDAAEARQKLKRLLSNEVDAASSR